MTRSVQHSDFVLAVMAWRLCNPTTRIRFRNERCRKTTSYLLIQTCGADCNIWVGIQLLLSKRLKSSRRHELTHCARACPGYFRFFSRHVATWPGFDVKPVASSLCDCNFACVFRENFSSHSYNVIKSPFYGEIRSVSCARAKKPRKGTDCVRRHSPREMIRERFAFWSFRRFGADYFPVFTRPNLLTDANSSDVLFWNLIRSWWRRDMRTSAGLFMQMPD